MFNLYQIVTGAQGGQGLDNLAAQFGITREQADGAVKALMPALSTAFMTKAAQPGGLGDIAGAMTDDQHKQAYADPATARQSQTRQKGDEFAGSIFGGDAIVGQVVAQAARFTGLPEDTLRQMLPVIVSTVLGGAATALHNQGLGGMLGQMAHGGLGGILGQFGGAATGQGAPGNTGGVGSFAGMVGNIMTMFTGGAQPASPQEPVAPTPGRATNVEDRAANVEGRATNAGAGATNPATGTAQTAADPAAALPPMVQAGLDVFAKLFQSGVPSSAAQPADLGATINASHASRR